MTLKDMKGLAICIANAFGAAGAEPVASRLIVPCMRPHAEHLDRFDQQRSLARRTHKHAPKELPARGGARLRTDDDEHVVASHHVVA